MRFASSLLGLSLLLAAQGAVAKEDDPALLFQKGRTAMKNGNCSTALEYLSRSQELDPAVGTAVNLAICEERTGRFSAALTHFQFVLNASSESDPRRAYAAARIAELEGKVAFLTVQRSRSDPPDTEVLLDGVELGRTSLGNPVRVDPGFHELVLSIAGQVKVREKLELRSGETRTWNPTLEEPTMPSAHSTSAPHPAPFPTAEPGATNRPPAESDASSSTSKTLGYVLGGVGVASLVTSAVFGALVLQKKDLVRRHCDGRFCDQTGLDANDQGNTFSAIATISAIIAVPTLGAGSYLMLSYDGGSDRTKSGARVGLSVNAF